MTDLITTLEGLTGPSREVDARICVALGLFVTRPNKGWPDRIDYGRHEPDGTTTWPGHGFDQLVPTLTASLDATIALCERVLPGWFWRVGRTSLFPNGWAYVSRTHPSHCDREDEAACADGRASSPAIALLIALLRAKEARR